MSVARKYAASHYARGAARVLSATVADPCPRGPGHVDFGPALPKQCVRVVVGTRSCRRVDVALYVRGSDVFAYDLLSFDGACR